VEELPYKEDERALFKSITRQVLFCDPELPSELRYFEMAPGGFSSLERHQHMHAVLILRGRGHCLVGDEVRPVETRDLVTVPAMTWHQFRATRGEPLGFLCMVNATRDKPQLPSAGDLAKLAADAKIAAFLRNEPT
jgi:mannose-6-phosphate isomerase-like protein (cupin superfamily)